MIKAIVTDFDGTLVDTYKANFSAYRKAFEEHHLTLSENEYRKCFGLRFDGFMRQMNVLDLNVAESIKYLKKKYYPEFFSELKLNHSLVELIDSFRSNGGMVAIASTAQKENLTNVLQYFDLQKKFDLIFAGTDVKLGKPNPEIYLKAMSALNVSPQETLIFEDSEIGVEAARASGAFCMRISL